MIHPQKLFVVGISFKKADIALRSRFAFAPDECSSTYSSMAADCFQHFFILSTCNRTEIYGFAPCEYLLLSLLRHHAKASFDEMNKCVYVKESNQAVRHFLSVASGLDSQIPGDYEIISQIKSAFQLAKAHGRTNGYLERLFNFSLEASKEVKASTFFSNGTVSVTYAAALKISKQKNICKVVVLGAGSTGQTVLGYLKKAVPQVKITLVSRNTEKSKRIASMFNIQAAPLEYLDVELCDADALVVATHSNHCLVHREHIFRSRIKLILDLSVPKNVAGDVCMMDQVKYYDVDSISSLTDSTVRKRLAEIPKVKTIITKFEMKFSRWSARQLYFSVSSQASVDGNLLSSKQLAGLFDLWHRSFQYDSSSKPHPAILTDSILSALKSAYPSVQLTKSTDNDAIP
ncbi:MAG TPA: glutamyl-tRNA reductase, partial [Chryseolinea sp.]